MSLKEKIKNLERKDGTGEERESEETIPNEIEYDELEYNDKGLIKRDGFKMNGVNYGPEFERENLNKAFKMAVAGIFIMIPLFALVLYLFWTHFEPFIGR